MNFVVFSAGNINVFPCANTHNGGQLMTEYNLRSRESVDTPEAIQYMSGKSYVHSKDDFAVSMQMNDSGTVISSTTLEIAPGRGVINGHFIESLTPILVDIADGNARAKANGDTVLKGNLSIGLKVMYSTEQTMAGAMLPENTDYLFEGVQVVVLPREEFKLPIDSPDDEAGVTAHIKLADFIYLNGAINQASIVNNYPNKCLSIDANRIGNFDNLLSGEYIKKTGLNRKYLYTFAGKGTNADGTDAWHNSTPSLMIWDKNLVETSTPPQYDSATFIKSKDDNNSDCIALYAPHDNFDGLEDNEGNRRYYKSVELKIPVADFANNTPGTVDSNYTRNIKAIRDRINTLYNLPAGRQIGYIDSLTDLNQLPPLNQNWNVGDYILVGQDQVAGAQFTDGSARYPCTIYVVLPGLVTSVVYNSGGLSGLSGMQIDSRSVSEAPNTTEKDVYNVDWGIKDDEGNVVNTTLRGIPNQDYMVATLTTEDSTTLYYYKVESSGEKVYSSAIMITGSIPLATEEAIGGFYNVDSSYLGNGYVGLDDSGHLRVLDYSLLASGVLAYQLGEDQIIGSGMTVDAIQEQLDELVNERVAFPNANHLQNGDNPYVINITLELSEEGEEVNINIGDIDSRFNTSIMLNILGTATSNTTINITNCQKLRIANNIGGNPKINLTNCCLYYDANIIDRLNSIENMTLWYERFEDTDPNLVIDHMKVISTDEPIVTEEIDYWSTEVPNDNHYLYALRSITFAGDGTIIGAEMYIKNRTTANVSLGTSIYSSQFRLPQGSGLSYPIRSLSRPVKIDGNFITAYSSSDITLPGYNPAGYTVIQTNFTAVSQVYDASQDDNMTYGTIALLATASFVDRTYGLKLGDTIEGWDSNSFHIFEGGVIG